MGPLVSLHGNVVALSAFAGKLILTPLLQTCQPAGFAWLNEPSMDVADESRMPSTVSVADCPGQIVEGIARAFVGGYTGMRLTTALVEYEVQEPFPITARNKVVCVKLVYVRVIAVLAIAVHVQPPFVEDSHLITEPELPPSVSEPVAEPVQTVVTAGKTVPPVGIV